RKVFETLDHAGALFFVELVRRTGLLPVQVEQGLSELAALGFVTADGFDGLRALLVPSGKRPTLGRNEGKRHRKTNIASVEFAGRWSLLRDGVSRAGDPPGSRSLQRGPSQTDKRDASSASEKAHEAAVEKFARVL